jgi:hypothetical protein
MDTPKKPSSDQIVFRSLFGGAIWGVAWSLFSCFLAVRTTPLFTLVINGLLIGLAFGFVNSMLILMAGGKHSVSLVLVILFSCGATLMSPSLEFFFVNIVAVVIGAWAISDFALKMKSDPVLERKEKRKNG